MRKPLLALAVVALCAGCASTPAQPPGPRPGHGAEQQARQRAARQHRASAQPRHLQVRRLAWQLPGPVAREAVVPLADGRHVVLAGGLLPGDVSSASTWTLDLRTGHARRGADLPVPVHDTAGALVHGHPVVLGGGNAAEQAVVQARTPQGWRVAGRLPSARSDLATARLGGRTLVIGGYDGAAPALGEVAGSRDAVHWSRVGRLPVPVRYPAVAVAGGSVWVFGGERSGAEVGVVQRIDPASGRARVVARLPHPLGHEAAVLLGRRILLIGGRTGPSASSARMWWFDPRSQQFSPAGRLPHPLTDSAVAQGRGQAWLVGGETPAFSARVLHLALVPSAR